MAPKKRKKRIDQASDWIVKWIGSLWSLLIHSVFFIIMMILPLFNINSDRVLLVLTTIVSLEAIYLAIFIQMTVNKQGKELEEVSDEIGEIQEDMEEIQEDMDEIQKDVEDIQEDVDEIQKDVEEIGEDVDEISEDIGETKEEEEDRKHDDKLLEIQKTLNLLISEISDLKSRPLKPIKKNKNTTKKKPAK
jgi:uncharacterized protein YoxC